MVIQAHSKRVFFWGEGSSLRVMNDLCRGSPPSLLKFQLLGNASLAGWLHLPSLLRFVPRDRPNHIAFCYCYCADTLQCPRGDISK
jgi:hypothetical protein